jgi:hypothetical protein
MRPRLQSQIVRPLASNAETHSQLQPALLRLSAMVSQYFMGDIIFPLDSRSANREKSASIYAPANR